MASLNAGPEYYAAEERYRSAKTFEEKIAALEDMLRLCPKHKAAESILMEIKNKLAKLRRVQESVAKKGSKRGFGEAVKKQGAAQVVLLGFANAGKSFLLNQLTNAYSPSTPAPFETASTIPGMMEYQNVQIQIVDTPSAYKANKSRLYALARVADLCVITLDQEQNAEAQKEFFADIPCAKKIFLVKGQKSADDVKKTIYDSLGLMRVFTKNPKTGIIEKVPIALPQGATVRQAAEQIHKELAENVKYARVWGSAKFAGQQVGLDYALKDGDVLELHEK